MRDKYNIKHAKKTTIKKRAIKWKVIIASISSIMTIALLFLVYLYFPAITGFIDSGIDYLLTPPGNIEKQNTIEKNSAGNTGEDNAEEEIKEEQEEEPEEIQEEIPEEESEEEEEVVEQGIAPTIQLIIYEGPSYSESDDICYYRVTASTTGDPLPEVTFSKDDSLGSLGPGKAQINITRDSQSITLNATAENSEGKSSDSILLNWSCNRSPDISGISIETDTMYVGNDYDISVKAVDLDGDDLAYLWSASGGEFDDDEAISTEWDTPDESGDYTITISVTDGAGNTSESSIVVYVGEKAPEPEPEPEPEPIGPDMDLPVKESEGGYIEYGGVTSSGGDIYAGDSKNNKPCNGFISFDLSGLSGKTIESATLTFSDASVSGDPLGFLDILWINVLDWGAEPIDQSDFSLSGILIASYDTPNITCNVSKLKEELQKAINADKSRFQIRIHFGGAYTDNDNNGDGWGYSQSKINLNITTSP